MLRLMPWDRSSNSITIMALTGTSSILVCSLAIMRKGPTGWHIFQGSFFKSMDRACCAASASNSMAAGDPAFFNPPGRVIPSGMDWYTPCRSGAPAAARPDCVRLLFVIALVGIRGRERVPVFDGDGDFHEGSVAHPTDALHQMSFFGVRLHAAEQP